MIIKFGWLKCFVDPRWVYIARCDLETFFWKLRYISWRGSGFFQCHFKQGVCLSVCQVCLSVSDVCLKNWAKKFFMVQQPFGDFQIQWCTEMCIYNMCSFQGTVSHVIFQRRPIDRERAHKDAQRCALFWNTFCCMPPFFPILPVFAPFCLFYPLFA